MSKNVQRVEAWLSDKHFYLYVLAALGVVAVPPPVVIGLISVSCMYQYMQNHSDENLKPIRERSVFLRYMLIYAALVLWCILAQVSSASSIPEVSAKALIVSSLTTYLLALCHSSGLFSKKVDKAATTNSSIEKQVWINCAVASFQMAFVYAVAAFVWCPNGFGDNVANWLIFSARDANLISNEYLAPIIEIRNNLHGDIILQKLPAPCEPFVLTVKVLLMGLLTRTLWGPAVRLSRILSTFVRNSLNKQAPHLALVRAVRAPRTVLQIRDRAPLFRNTCKTFLWLLSCYGVLVYIFGIMRGPIGDGICNWFDVILGESSTGLFRGASDNPNVHLFLGAVVALFGTVPIAISNSVFLNCFRRRQFEINKDGLFFPEGPSWSLFFKPVRLWSDLSSVSLIHAEQVHLGRLGKVTLIISFHSGGKLQLQLSQLSKNDLEKLLAHIDENASDCLVGNDVIDLRARLRLESHLVREASEFNSLGAENFQSTIFVPLEPGDWLPNGETRVVRLLASRPLSCVYLVRNQRGQLLVVKQFFLPAENEETAALRKCFARESEMLKALDHKSLGKVVEVFDSENSTFLVLEHAQGSDLRSIVLEDGPQSEEKVFDWALQLCDIMIYLHTQTSPVVHRDLTPDNVVLCDDGSLKIIDFGAAHHFLEGVTGTVIGKQSYVPIEQLQGNAGPQSDIYSFGGMLYFLLTAKEPVALTQLDPAASADVSEFLNCVIKACTEYSAADRPQSFVAVKEMILEARKAPVDAVRAKLRNVFAEWDLKSKQSPLTSEHLPSLLPSNRDEQQVSVHAQSNPTGQESSGHFQSKPTGPESSGHFQSKPTGQEFSGHSESATSTTSSQNDLQQRVLESESGPAGMTDKLSHAETVDDQVEKTSTIQLLDRELVEDQRELPEDQLRLNLKFAERSQILVSSEAEDNPVPAA